MAKLVLLFSLSSLLAFYIMFSYPSCTIVCLLVCVLFCFLELNMWLLDCVIFCNCFLDHFIVFFWQMSHICMFRFGRFLPMLCPRLLWAFAALLVFYCSRCLCLLCFCLLLPFVGCLCCFDVFVTNSICVILLAGFVFGWYICGLVLLFRLLISFLSCLFMTSMHWLNRSPRLLPICSSLSSSLDTTNICVNVVCVLPYPSFAKHVLCAHFRLFLSRFPFHPVNLYPIAPIRINYYPFTLILDHSAQNPHNIMSGEISPVIVHKSWPIRPQIPPSCLVFVLFNIPCTKNHLSSPIYTHLYLFLPVCTQISHVCVCNLIKKIVSNDVIFHFFASGTSSYGLKSLKYM